MRNFYQKYWGVILNLALLIATLFIAFIAFKLVIPYFWPFLLGLVLAAAIEPVVRLFSRLNLPRTLSAGLALSIALGALSAAAWLAFSRLVVELLRLLSNTAEISETLKNLGDSALNWIQAATQGLPPEMLAYINKNTERVTEMFSAKISLLAGEALKILTGLPNQMLVILIAVISAFFISKDLPQIKNRLISWVPAEYKPKLALVAGEIYIASLGFIKAQAILSAITALVILTGLTILGTNYTVLLALLGGLASPVPVLGVGLVFIPWIVVALLNGNTSLAGGLAVLFAVVIIVKHSLEPKILGENIGLDPLSVLISLYVGYELMGAYGFILGPFVLITYNALQRAKAFAWIFQDGKNPPPKNSPPPVPK